MPKTSGIYHRDGTLTPCDAKAGRDIGRGGIHYHPPIEIFDTGFEGKPPTQNPPQDLLHLLDASVGRLRILGVLPKKHAPDGKFLWVVRCTCGAYEYRSTAAITKASKYNTCCRSCLHLGIIKGEHNQFRNQFPIDYLQAMSMRFIGEDAKPTYVVEEGRAREYYIAIVSIGGEEIARAEAVGKQQARRDAATAAIQAKCW